MTAVKEGEVTNEPAKKKIRLQAKADAEDKVAVAVGQ